MYSGNTSATRANNNKNGNIDIKIEPPSKLATGGDSTLTLSTTTPTTTTTTLSPSSPPNVSANNNNNNNQQQPQMQRNGKIKQETANNSNNDQRMEWSRETILGFIEDYRNERVLWDPNCRGYHIKQIKYEALQDLGSKYGAEIRAIRSKIKSLRSSFHREHGKVINGLKKGVIYQPVWFAYEAIKFILEDNVERKPSINAYDADLSPPSVAGTKLNTNFKIKPNMAKPHPNINNATTITLSDVDIVMKGDPTAFNKEIMLLAQQHNFTYRTTATSGNNKHLIDNKNDVKLILKTPTTPTLSLTSSTTTTTTETTVSPSASITISKNRAKTKHGNGNDNDHNNNNNNNNNNDSDGDDNNDDGDEDELKNDDDNDYDDDDDDASDKIDLSTFNHSDYLDCAMKENHSDEHDNNVKDLSKAAQNNCQVESGETHIGYNIKPEDIKTEIIESDGQPMNPESFNGIPDNPRNVYNAIDNNDIIKQIKRIKLKNNNDDRSNQNNEQSMSRSFIHKNNNNYHDNNININDNNININDNNNNNNNESEYNEQPQQQQQRAIQNSSNNNLIYNNNIRKRKAFDTCNNSLSLLKQYRKHQKHEQYQKLHLQQQQRHSDYISMAVNFALPNTAAVGASTATSSGATATTTSLPSSPPPLCATSFALETSASRTPLTTNATSTFYGSCDNHQNDNQTLSSLSLASSTLLQDNQKNTNNNHNNSNNNAADEYSIFGDYVAITIRKLKTSKSKIVVKHIINNLLYEAEMGKYDLGMPASKDPPQLYKISTIN